MAETFIAGPLQMRILEHLWKHGAGDVRTVWQALNAQPGAPTLAYTTILTVMRILAGHGVVTRTTGQRRHLYTPALAQGAYRAAAARWFIAHHFSGDHSAALNAIGAAGAAKAG